MTPSPVCHHHVWQHAAPGRRRLYSVAGAWDVAEGLWMSALSHAAGETRDGRTGFDDEGWRRLVEGIIAFLAAATARAEDVRPWPETDFGSSAEPCTVHHGIGGTVAALTGLVRNGAGANAPALLDSLLSRLADHVEREPHRLPGMHFGAAGTAWTLCEAGHALGCPRLVDLARSVVDGLAVPWPNPDVSHGVAGHGMAGMHLWRRTLDDRFLERAVRCADHLLTAADPGIEALWTIDPSSGSRLAGTRTYGFAHGTAGIGAFLLDAGIAAQRRDFLDAAARCAGTLLDAAIRDGDAMFWPASPGGTRKLPHWCHGSSGVGTFLCRWYAHSADSGCLAAATAAARAVMRLRWRSSTAYCHGLAGDADFLIDLSQATGDDTYAAWASVMAGRLWARRVDRDGRTVLPDETGRAVTGGYAVGLSGHLAFLVRLRYGGERLFHPPIPTRR